MSLPYPTFFKCHFFISPFLVLNTPPVGLTLRCLVSETVTLFHRHSLNAVNVNCVRVDVFKLSMHDGQERRQMLCTLHIIPTSSVQVIFLSLFSDMYLLL